MRLPHCPMQSKLTSHFDFNFNANHSPTRNATPSHEVTPTQSIPILLFDPTKQSTGIAQACIVHPTPLRLETHPATCATTSLRTVCKLTAGASTVPSQSNHEATVIATISWRTTGTLSHHCCEVCLQSSQVEIFKCRSVRGVIGNRKCSSHSGSTCRTKPMPTHRSCGGTAYGCTWGTCT